MATMEILDRLGATQVVEKPLPPGPAADTLSRPVALSTQDRALFGATNETTAVSDTATSGHSGLLKRIAQNISALSAAIISALNNVVIAAGNAVIGKVKLVDADGVDLVFVKSTANTGRKSMPANVPQLLFPANSNRQHAQAVVNHATAKVYWATVNYVSLINGHVLLPGVPHDFDGYLGEVWGVSDIDCFTTTEDW